MKFWLCTIALIFQFSVFAQNIDNEQLQKNLEDTTEQHSVKKAAIFSAIIPGAGQIYNHIAMPKGKKKAFWKVPLIYVGLGTTGYFAFKNHALQKELKLEYINRTENNLYSDKYLYYDNQGILQLYEQKLTNRDLLFVGMGLVYLLQIAEAAVEAHFVKFDVSEDLTLKIQPTIIPFSSYQMASLGVKFKLNLK